MLRAVVFSSYHHRRLPDHNVCVGGRGGSSTAVVFGCENTSKLVVLLWWPPQRTSKSKKHCRSCHVMFQLDQQQTWRQCSSRSAHYRACHARASFNRGRACGCNAELLLCVSVVERTETGCSSAGFCCCRCCYYVCRCVYVCGACCCCCTRHMLAFCCVCVCPGCWTLRGVRVPRCVGGACSGGRGDESAANWSVLLYGG